MLSDSRLGNLYAYTYNAANRLKTVSFQGNLVGTYTYNGGEQLIQRVITNSGSSNGTIQYVHDRMGNIIAEATSAGATAREYIWLPEAEIAPTFQSRAQVDRPVAVVDGVNTATPQTWYVAVDHLHRPIRMTNAAKSVMWSATWTPFLFARLRHDGCAACDHGGGCARCAVHFACPPPAGRAVVPARAPDACGHPKAPLKCLALQLASALRSDPRPLHPARSARVRRRAERVWVCRRIARNGGGSGWAVLARGGSGGRDHSASDREVEPWKG